MILLYIDTDSTANDVADFTIFIFIGVVEILLIVLFTALGIYYRFQGKWFYRCCDFFVKNPRITVEQLYRNPNNNKPIYTMDKHYPLKIILEVTTPTGELVGLDVSPVDKSTTRLHLEEETTEDNPEFLASQLSHLTSAPRLRKNKNDLIVN